MKNKINPVYLFFFLILVIDQNIEILGQNGIPELLRQRFQSYTEAVPMEEVFIHTDRVEYIAGEELWFAVYLIDRQSHRPTTSSSIAYFEIINTGNRPVVQKRIYLENGSGPGQITLPDTLSTGIYTIRAYTNRMKNFLPQNCFVRDIRIYNPFNGKNLKVMPGNSVKNPVKVIDESGSGTPCQGINLIINSYNRDSIEIRIKADEKYRSENNTQFYLFIQTHGIIDYIGTEKMTGENKKIILPVSSLTPGINQVTVFDSKGQPVCSAYNFTPLTDSAAVLVNTGESFGVREKVAVKLEMERSLADKLKSGNISISVAPLTRESQRTDLKDYLIYGTEYAPELNGFKYAENSGILQEHIRSNLLNIKSDWIDWSKILSGKIPVPVYKTEKDFHFLGGRLIPGEKPLSSSEYVLLCIPGNEPEFQYAKSDSSGNFSFKLHIDETIKDLVLMADDESSIRKIITESGFAEQNTPVQISAVNEEVSIPQYINDWGVNYQIKKIYRVPSTGNPVKNNLHPLTPVRFYGKPDIELVMADYVTLPKMEEVFFELLPHVSLRKRIQGYEIKITDRINESRYESSPDLFLDGVKINDASLYADLDPSDVERIDVIKGKYFVGGYSFPGLINLTTRTADFSIVQMPGYMTRLPYRVTDPVPSFFSPDYSSPELKNSTIPDFRNTLYWNPSVKADAEGKFGFEFPTSDFVTEYEINVQGITSDGKIISERKTFRVE